MDKDFNEFWDAYHPNEIRFPRRRAATFRAWNERTPAARRAMLEQVKKEGAPEWKNPYFFVVDFPEPQPEFLSGLDQDKLREKGIPMVQVKYKDKFLICTRKTMDLFGLEWNRDW